MILWRSLPGKGEQDESVTLWLRTAPGGRRRRRTVRADRISPEAGSPDGVYRLWGDQEDGCVSRLYGGVCGGLYQRNRPRRGVRARALLSRERFAKRY